MYDAIRSLLGTSDVSVVESFKIDGRPARFESIPDYLFDSKVGTYLNQEFASGLWKHQAQALKLLGKGSNVVVSTGTASGKSLIFRASAFHRVLLNPSSKTIVFYPQLALVEDQLTGWRSMANSLGLNPDTIGRIDGSVRVSEREGILERAQIIIMTPDVCQAWMMSRLALQVVKDFIGNLGTVVMDEAHTLEGVFGSNFSFLIRRLHAARAQIVGNDDNRDPAQMIAATATISRPGEHMRRLTGFDFDVIDHDLDGAQQHERLVAHVACPPGEELSIARQLQEHVLTHGRDGGFITFMDSRKGVETLAMATEEDVKGLFSDPAVNAYRAGYVPVERREIERKLRTGVLKGVISTSALELGIDFPSLTVGFNLGLPHTRKAYRQRLGRVGRNGPGAFIVVGTPNEFRQYGTSLAEYHAQSVEPSYLYLENRFMQFAHGRCLSEEQDALSAGTRLPSAISWPAGFERAYSEARPGGSRSPEFDAIAELGGDAPHYGYPLRNIGEQSFQIKLSENADSMGEVSQSQALRECYPGGTYYHNMEPYYISAWLTRTSFRPYIRVRKGARGRSTKPRITTWLNSTITSQDVIDRHLLKGERGFLSECRMMITERVNGFTDRTGSFQSYRELQSTNPNLKPRSRNVRTTGVIVCIDQEYFTGSTRRHFSEVLRDVFAHRFSLSPQDIGSTWSNISVLDGDGKQRGSRCVAVFDQTYGSLRFTEQLYAEFDLVLRQVLNAATLISDPDIDFVSIIKRAQDVVASFESTSPFNVDVGNIPSGYEQMFASGSRVCFRESGALSEDVTVIEPAMINGNLMYRVEVNQSRGPALRRYIPYASVEPSADADTWEYQWWNRETQTYLERTDEDSG